MSSARLVKLAREARRCCLAAVLALVLPATLAATPGSSQQQAAVEALKRAHAAVVGVEVEDLLLGLITIGACNRTACGPSALFLFHPCASPGRNVLRRPVPGSVAHRLLRQNGHKKQACSLQEISA